MNHDQALAIIRNPPAQIAPEQQKLIEDIAAAIITAVFTAGWSKKLPFVLMFQIGKAIWPHILKLFKLRNIPIQVS